MPHRLRQVNIVHVSDVHFGRNHICAPDAPDWANVGLPDLGVMIQHDIEQRLAANPELGRPPTTPLIFAATGDLTETASVEDETEFERAEAFLRRISRARRPDNDLRSLFVVPGNHDVVFNETSSAERRWQPYCRFYNRLFADARAAVSEGNAHALTQLHDRTADGYVVAEVNSAFYVARGSADAERGQIDNRALEQLGAQLEELRRRTPETFESAVRIALMHHHPVLMPSLVEPGRGYDAIANGHRLLRLLQEFGFHLILHGHKHYPQTFSYDPDYAWSTKPRTPPPLLIVAGGSAGSSGLPDGTRRANSYNLITIKWHPDAGHARVQVRTRGLQRTDEEGAMAPDQWHWTDYAFKDRLVRPFDSLPATVGEATVLPPIGSADDRDRRAVYESTRGNMAVAEVFPSMCEGQAYEARVWIVPHSRNPENVPVEVTWNAGPKFERRRVTATDDPKFCATLSYWGSMLVEARLKFCDGQSASAFVYARIP